MRRGQVPRPRAAGDLPRVPPTALGVLRDARGPAAPSLLARHLPLLPRPRRGRVRQRMTNPRLGLSAHLGGVMTGTFLAVLGALWSELRLSSRAESAAYRLAFFGAYGSSASLLLAAILGTSSATPIAGAGHSAPGWQEAMVNLGLETTAAAMLLCCLLLLWGLRGRR